MSESKTPVPAEVRKLKLGVDQIARTKSVLNANQIALLYRRTPKSFQFQRPGKGGGQWDYAKKGYIRKQLDALFGFNWDFTEFEDSILDLLQVAQATGSVVVRGRITGRILDDRGNLVAEITKSNTGKKEVTFKKGTKEPLDFGNDVKAAYTDCFKRCAAMIGIASDLYDQDEFIDIEVKGSDDDNAKDENTKKLAQAAKAELEK